MNKLRREEISKVKRELLNSLEKINNILYEEEYCFENMPENLQASLRGSESQDAIDVLEECSELLERVIEKLCEIR